MKTFIAASLLLALVTPTHASKLRTTDKPWVSSVKKYGGLYDKCYYSTFPEELKISEQAAGTAREKPCNSLSKLEKKLKANGYCLIGRGVVGRPGNHMKEYPDTRHCYTIEWGIKWD